MRHALHIPLVHLDDDVPLPKATAARVVHDLLHPLPSTTKAVRDSEAKALVSFLHVYSDEFWLRCDGRSQGYHVARVAELGGGIGRYLGGGAVRSGEAIERRSAVDWAIGALTALARRRVVAACDLLAVDDDGIFVIKDGHRGYQTGVWIIGVERQWVATTQLQVDHGADRDGLKDLHNLGVRVAQHAGVIYTHNHIPFEVERKRACSD